VNKTYNPLKIKGLTLRESGLVLSPNSGHGADMRT